MVAVPWPRGEEPVWSWSNNYPKSSSTSRQWNGSIFITAAQQTHLSRNNLLSNFFPLPDTALSALNLLLLLSWHKISTTLYQSWTRNILFFTPKGILLHTHCCQRNNLKLHAGLKQIFWNVTTNQLCQKNDLKLQVLQIGDPSTLQTTYQSWTLK